MTSFESEAPRRLRVLVLTSTYPRWAEDPEPGFVHELSKRFIPEFEVRVLAPHAKGAAPKEVLDGLHVERYRYAPAAFESLVNDGGIVTNLRRHPWKWLLVPGFFIAMWWSAWWTVRSWRPNVVHAHWLIPQGVIAVILGRGADRSPPFVVTTHGADLFALRSSMLQRIKRYVARHAHAVAVVSRAMATEAMTVGIPAGKLRVEPMGADLTARFRCDDAAVRQCSELLFVGRFVEKKGLDYLLDAMPAIVATRPGTRLSVVGFGPLEARYRKKARALGVSGNVVFHGAVPQSKLVEHYRRASVFVAPFVQATSGDREGLGLVLVEAAGCGCPIVVSDLPAVRDVVDETTATLVPAGDSNALAAACLDLLAHPERAQAQASAARMAVAQRFDWTARADAYKALLREAVP